MHYEYAALGADSGHVLSIVTYQPISEQYLYHAHVT